MIPDPDLFDDIDIGTPLVSLDLPPEQLRLVVEDAHKPRYRVPLMSEIEAVEPNGYKLISTFSGCGGSCLGFRMAGYETLLASEFVPAAVDTYAANHPLVPLAVGDVRHLEPELVLARLGLARGELDVLEGSPPCASFSMVGNREQNWGEVKKYSDVTQRVDDLFFEFVRLVDGFLPKVVVGENVSGLMLGNAVEYFNAVRRMLDDLGYLVYAKELNAAWYGVPQNRRRIIILAVRRDLGVQPVFPDRLGYGYSVRDAIGHGIDTATEDTSIENYAIGKEWDRLQVGVFSDRYMNLIKPDFDLPSPTITQSGGTRGAAGVTHPTEKRKFTIAELRRICSFPDDFVLTGSWSQQWERLGRAVPPLMMRAVAIAIRDQILDEGST